MITAFVRRFGGRAGTPRTLRMPNDRNCRLRQSGCSVARRACPPLSGRDRRLERIAAAVLDAAKRGGATAAETEVSQGIGQSVTVRQDAVETISYNRDKGISVTVFVGQRRGHASTADFADEAIAATVDKALAIARYTAEDPAAGLADPARLARSWPDLDLYHPWDLPVEAARSSSA